MVKRKSKPKKRVNRQKGVSVIGLAETYLLMNVATQTMFRTNPITFFTSKGEAGSATISLREIMSPSGRFYNNPATSMDEGNAGYYIMSNIKRQWGTALIQMALIPAAFRLGKAVARPAINRTNRLLAKGGIANTVKL